MKGSICVIYVLIGVYVVCRYVYVALFEVVWMVSELGL